MNNCEKVPAENISYMGYTVRSPDYRFTMWFHWDGAECEAKWDSPLEGWPGCPPESREAGASVVPLGGI